MAIADVPSGSGRSAGPEAPIVRLASLFPNASSPRVLSVVA